VGVGAIGVTLGVADGVTLLEAPVTTSVPLSTAAVSEPLRFTVYDPLSRLGTVKMTLPQAVPCTPPAVSMG
jgi:hypothetical protein